MRCAFECRLACICCCSQLLATLTFNACPSLLECFCFRLLLRCATLCRSPSLVARRAPLHCHRARSLCTKKPHATPGRRLSCSFRTSARLRLRSNGFYARENVHKRPKLAWRRTETHTHTHARPNVCGGALFPTALLIGQPDTSSNTDRRLTREC